jgi:hypothetical protein
MSTEAASTTPTYVCWGIFARLGMMTRGETVRVDHLTAALNRPKISGLVTLDQHWSGTDRECAGKADVISWRALLAVECCLWETRVVPNWV